MKNSRSPLISPKLSEVSSLCPSHILFPSFFFHLHPSFHPEEKGGGLGGLEGRGFAAKNCMDTRGGWEAAGRRQGGLCCCGTVSMSETGPSQNQPVSMSERVCICVYDSGCACSMADFIPSEQGESNHTLLKCATLMPMNTQYPRLWKHGDCWSIKEPHMRIMSVVKLSCSDLAQLIKH